MLYQPKSLLAEINDVKLPSKVNATKSSTQLKKKSNVTAAIANSVFIRSASILVIITSMRDKNLNILTRGFYHQLKLLIILLKLPKNLRTIL